MTKFCIVAKRMFCLVTGDDEGTTEDATLILGLTQPYVAIIIVLVIVSLAVITVVTIITLVRYS